MDIPGSDDLMDDAARLLESLRSAGFMLATAESCTGGLIVATLTEVAGSSDAVDRGFVTYSNEAKAELLGVDMKLILEHGAVSEPVARAMATGALDHSRAHIAVSVTGIAGPGGGTEMKPIGLVHLAAARRGAETVHEHCEFGDAGRAEVRRLSVQEAFRLVRTLL